MHQNAQSKDKIRRQEEHIKNINLYQKQYAVMAIQDVVKFYVQTINYNGISEAANSHSSHLVLFRSLEEQGEGKIMQSVWISCLCCRLSCLLFLIHVDHN